MQKPTVRADHFDAAIKRTRRGFASLLALPLFLAAAATACAPREGPQPNTPDTSATAPSDGAGPAPQGSGAEASGGAQPAAANPFEVKRTLREERFPAIAEDAPIDASAPKLPAPPKGLAAPPKTCDALAKQKPERAPPCAEAAAALAALDAALAIENAIKRDASLAGLEACAGLPVGAVREIRAELAPTECADVVAEPALKAPPLNMRKTAYYSLLGHALAARLSRTAQSPPTMSPPFERKRVEEFLKGPMLAWMTEQARIIEEIAKAGVELPYYAKGVVAVEAGMADMRVVDVVRGAPVPKEIGSDEELRNVYYASLDQQLDPRKDRGRDAALVGLRDLAIVGVIKDARVDKARSLLSKLYGGRRIDALDALLLPPLPAGAPASAEERLAGKLPTLAAGLLLDPKAATRASTLRAFLGKGVPVPQRIALKDPAAITPEVAALYARAHMELGRLYWRASDFDRVIALTSKASDEGKRTDEASLLLATAIALSDGPEDAAEMMRKAPLTNMGVGQVAALDALAKGRGPYAGMAAFNAALVLQIAAPQGAKATYWKDVAARFQSAATMLPEGAMRSSAEERARAAEAVAAAIK